jgi:hypothetical protein
LRCAPMATVLPSDDNDTE